MSGALLVTGATGFVGRALLDRLIGLERVVIALVRHWHEDLPPGVVQRITPSIETLDEDGWLTALEGVEAVAHLAAIAHVGPDVPPDAYDAVNHRAVAALGSAAVRAGVRRLVFLSSTRAQAGAWAPEPFDETTMPAPTDAYGRAKLAAEQALAELPLETVILRPALVIGNPPKGNLALLLRLAQSPLPLPLANLHAPRAAISLLDIVELIVRALDDPAMAGGTFIAADPDPPGVADMISALREGLGRQPGLFALPQALLSLPFLALGRGDLFDRLARPLAARPAALVRLGWRPVLPVRDGLRQLAEQTRSAAQRSE